MRHTLSWGPAHQLQAGIQGPCQPPWHPPKLASPTSSPCQALPDTAGDRLIGPAAGGPCLAYGASSCDLAWDSASLLAGQHSGGLSWLAGWLSPGLDTGMSLPGAWLHSHSYHHGVPRFMGVQFGLPSPPWSTAARLTVSSAGEQGGYQEGFGMGPDSTIRPKCSVSSTPCHPIPTRPIPIQYPVPLSCPGHCPPSRKQTVMPPIGLRNTFVLQALFLTLGLFLSHPARPFPP